MSDDLTAKLDAATEGSRDLDSNIRLWVIAAELAKGRDGGEVRKELGHWDVDKEEWNVPHYTTSIDAALTLVPEGMVFEIANYGSAAGICRAAVWWATEDGEIGTFDGVAGAQGETPALALCIAALKARKATP